MLCLQLDPDDLGHPVMWILAQGPSRSGGLFQGPPWAWHKPYLGGVRVRDRLASPRHRLRPVSGFLGRLSASHTGTRLCAHSATQQTSTRGRSCQPPQTAHSFPRAAPVLQAEPPRPPPSPSSPHLPCTHLGQAVPGVFQASPQGSEESLVMARSWPSVGRGFASGVSRVQSC